MKRTRLKSVSDKRRAQLREYSRLRKEHLKASPVCEICKTGKSWDVHHRAGRIGRRLLETWNWLLVCRSCHNRIHDNPAWARDQGYLIR